MGIWDKAKVLGGDRLDQEYEEGTPFILYAMASAGEVPEGTFDPAGDEMPTKTVLLTQEATTDGAGGWTPIGEGKVVGTLSGPIAEMASQAATEDFPVVVSWQKVPTKRGGADATVLDYLGAYEGEPLEAIPGEWGQYS